jgi:hypothetical protein
MLKNIWEIENNPIFSSGGSIRDERDDNVIPSEMRSPDNLLTEQISPE